MDAIHGRCRSATQIIFELQLGGAAVAQSATLAVTGLLTGAALVEVAATPGIVRLVNATGEDVFIGAVAVQGNIVIYKVAP